MLTFEFVAPRVAADVSRLYVEARVAGLKVSHSKRVECTTFDGAPGGPPGVFRRIGELNFLKDDRRWWVRAWTDASATELATLISFGLKVVRDHGERPGHWTRGRAFHHQTWEDGTRIAAAFVCYRLGVDDLLGATTSTTVDVDGLVSALLGAEETSR